MRYIKSSRLVVGLIAALSAVLVCVPSTGATAAPLPPASQTTQKTAGITIAPAALTLDVAKGTSQTTTTFTITNSYPTPVLLAFEFEQDQQLSDADIPAVIQQLHLAATELSLESGQSATQTVALQDSTQLKPGGHQLSLVVRQVSDAGGAVGINSGIRLPLVVIKEDGAVTQLGLASVNSGGFAFSLPNTVTAVLRNTGNMIAIPHGVITVTGPGGKVLRQGTVNVASRAISPGHDGSFATPLTDIGHVVWPGIYHVQLSYGLGGDYPTQIVSRTILFVAWWHIAIFLVLAGIIYYGVTHRSNLRHIIQPKKKPPARRSVPFGGHVT